MNYVIIETPGDGLGKDVAPKITRFQAASHVLARERGREVQTEHNKVEVCLILPHKKPKSKPDPFGLQSTKICKVAVSHP